MSLMVTVVFFFLVGLAWWSFVQISVSRGIATRLDLARRPTESSEQDDLPQLLRKNLRALLIGLLTAAVGASSVFIGLVSAFGDLETVPADQRAALLSGRISSTMSIAGLPTLFAFVFGFVVPIVWWIQRRKIIESEIDR